MKVVSFNIRCDYDQDGKNNFKFRKELILNKIKEQKPDVIGFQEVLPHVQQWLTENLSDYMVVGCGRDENYQNEYMTIILRKETVELYGLEVFWLSPSPYVPGTRYPEQSTCPRTCASVIIKCKEFDTPIRIYNTHLDHAGKMARKLGLDQILDHMEQDKEKFIFPIILMGDFNASPESEELQTLALHPTVPLYDAAKDLGDTFHCFGNEKEFSKIDYVFLGEELSVEKAELWKDCKQGVYLSDHYPVCAEIHLCK